ncbi:hypothetical protein IJT10_02425, partial [bacterium]|nr:hypothetical protein [bacterium]
KPVRFQYYHLGGREDNNIWLRLRIKNNGLKKARLQIIEGVGGPDGNYFRAGHDNNVNFLANFTSRKDRLIEIAPQSEVDLFTKQLPYDKVISGTEQFTLWQGDNVQYYLLSMQDPQEEVSFSELSDSSDVHARGFYPLTDRFVSLVWDMQREIWVPVGGVRQPNYIKGPELKGDYGTIYSVKYLILNDNDEEKKFTLYFNPRGGAATATVYGALKKVENVEPSQWLNDNIPSWQGASSVGDEFELWEVAQEVKAREMYPVQSFNIPAHTRAVLHTITVPEGASNYPIRLVLSTD